MVNYFLLKKEKKKVEKQGNYKEQRIKNASKNSPIRNVLSLSQQHKKTRKKKGKIKFEKKNWNESFHPLPIILITPKTTIQADAKKKKKSNERDTKKDKI